MQLQNNMTDQEIVNQMIKDEDVSLPLKEDGEFRANIISFEEVMLKNPNSLGADPFPLKHSFADGLYCREATAPAGALLISRIQKYNHATFLLKGKCSVLSEDGVRILQAPMSFITKAGTKRVVYCVEETTWATVHATNTTDLEEINSELYASDFKDVPDIKDIAPVVYQNPKDEVAVEFIKNFRELTRKVFSAEKKGFWSDWTSEQKELYRNKDWDSFSRSRGYTDEQIINCKLWIEILNSSDRLGIDTLSVIRDITVEKALESLDKSVEELRLNSRFQLQEDLICHQS